MTTKDMKVEISSGNYVNTTGLMEIHSAQGELMRQPSMTKTNCLCSPTTHAGSFRCRLHRTPSFQRTKSMESSTRQDAVGIPNVCQKSHIG
uniref:Uncharacterized protein n=1 Tax=Lotus japonicus TaxID=34305 RepID=I3STM1_LOTJA|nr:unknown [Lotus japonicus]